MSRQKKNALSIDERIEEQHRILLDLESQRDEAAKLLNALQEEKDNQIAKELLLAFKQSGRDYEEFLKEIKEAKTTLKEKEDQ